MTSAGIRRIGVDEAHSAERERQITRLRAWQLARTKRAP
jgi:hypothetical protein